MFLDISVMATEPINGTYAETLSQLVLQVLAVAPYSDAFSERKP